MRLALAEIGEWGALARKIRVTEKLGMLNPRVRTLWLPGVMGIAAAMLTNVALSALLRRIPDGGMSFIKAINHSGSVMAFLGLLPLAGWVCQFGHPLGTWEPQACDVFAPRSFPSWFSGFQER